MTPLRERVAAIRQDYARLLQPYQYDMNRLAAAGRLYTLAQLVDSGLYDFLNRNGQQQLLNRLACLNPRSVRTKIEAESVVSMIKVLQLRRTLPWMEVVDAQLKEVFLLGEPLTEPVGLDNGLSPIANPSLAPVSTFVPHDDETANIFVPLERLLEQGEDFYKWEGESPETRARDWEAWLRTIKFPTNMDPMVHTLAYDLLMVPLPALQESLGSLFRYAKSLNIMAHLYQAHGRGRDRFCQYLFLKKARVLNFLLTRHPKGLYVTQDGAYYVVAHRHHCPGGLHLPANRLRVALPESVLMA